MFQRYAHVDNISGVSINSFPNDRLIKLLSSPSISRNSTHFAVGLSLIEPGRIHEEHSHDAEEVIYIISGKGELTINGNEIVSLSKGTVIVLKAGEKHSIKVLGDEQLVCLWIYAPPGPEKKFIENNVKKIM